MRDQEYFTSTPSLINVRDFPKLLRASSRGKAVQPDMHFRAKTDLERIFYAIRENEALIDEQEQIRTYEQIEKSARTAAGMPMSGTLQTFEAGKTTSTFNRSCSYSNSSKSKAHVAEVAKRLRAPLHNKTHFQAVLALVHKQSKSLAQPVTSKKQPGSLDIEDAFTRVHEQLKKMSTKELPAVEAPSSSRGL